MTDRSPLSALDGQGARRDELAQARRPAPAATEPGRRRPDRTAVEELQPCDYCKRGSVWWVCLPTGQLGHIDSGWTVTEHPDGTITVSPSIHDAPDGWHGWLERGVWRSV